MLYLSVALFALTAILGLTILIKWLTKKEASKAVIYSHGAVAALGLVLLIVYALQNPANFPKASIILFTVGAVAGFYMFFGDLKKKPHPLVLACVHALVGVGGFLALLLFVFA
jgi:hypothetical protein